MGINSEWLAYRQDGENGEINMFYNWLNYTYDITKEEYEEMPFWLKDAYYDEWLNRDDVNGEVY